MPTPPRFERSATGHNNKLAVSLARISLCRSSSKHDHAPFQRRSMTEQTLAAPIDEELERGFSRYQSRLIALLALVQFTVILDFIIMSPLGAILMSALDITAAQFG